MLVASQVPHRTPLYQHTSWWIIRFFIPDDFLLLAVSWRLYARPTAPREIGWPRARIFSLPGTTRFVPTRLGTTAVTSARGCIWASRPGLDPIRNQTAGRCSLRLCSPSPRRIFGSCSMMPFEFYVPEGSARDTSRPHRINPIFRQGN